MKRWVKWLIAFVVLLGVGGAIAYWYITRQFDNTKDLKAAYSTNSTSIFNEVMLNDSVASLKYKDKVLEITGTINEISINDSTGAIVLTDSIGKSQVLTSLQTSEVKSAKAYKVGDQITVKGVCTSVQLFSKQIKEEVTQVAKADSLTSDDDLSMLDDEEPVEVVKEPTKTTTIRIEKNVKIALIRSVLITNKK